MRLLLQIYPEFGEGLRSSTVFLGNVYKAVTPHYCKGCTLKKEAILETLTTFKTMYNKKTKIRFE